MIFDRGDRLSCRSGQCSSGNVSSQWNFIYPWHRTIEGGIVLRYSAVGDWPLVNVFQDRISGTKLVIKFYFKCETIPLLLFFFWKCEPTRTSFPYYHVIFEAENEHTTVHG